VSAAKLQAAAVPLANHPVTSYMIRQKAQRARAIFPEM
jgi:hypothetical protein